MLFIFYLSMWESGNVLPGVFAIRADQLLFTFQIKMLDELWHLGKEQVAGRALQLGIKLQGLVGYFRILVFSAVANCWRRKGHASGISEKTK